MENRGSFALVEPDLAGPNCASYTNDAWFSALFNRLEQGAKLHICAESVRQVRDKMASLTPDTEPGLLLARTRLIAVSVVDDADSAVPLAESLLSGGVRAIELTLRTPAALEAARRIAEHVPDMILGIGTILTEEQVNGAKEAGARFGVSPGTNPGLLRHAASVGLPFGPGVMTPTDIDMAMAEGARLLKFFPAQSSGGLAHLKNIAAPFAHLGPRFVPLGGITLDNLEDWLGNDLIAAVGGSWLAPRDLVAAGDWNRIEQNAREAVARLGS